MVKKILLDLISLIRTFIEINWNGWSGLLSGPTMQFVTWVRQLGLYRSLFLGSAILLIAIALPGWIEYRVQFLTTENLTVSSSLKWLFLLPGFFGLVFFTFDLPRRREIYFVIVAIVAILYLLGLYLPQMLHTSMIHEADYHFSPFVFIYGPLLLLNGVSAWAALQVPLIDPRTLLDHLSRPAVPAADITSAGKQRSLRNSRPR